MYRKKTWLTITILQVKISSLAKIKAKNYFEASPKLSSIKKIKLE